MVRADDKHRARLNIVRDMLSRLDEAGRSRKLVPPDRAIVFPFSDAALEARLIAP